MSGLSWSLTTEQGRDGVPTYFHDLGELLNEINVRLKAGHLKQPGQTIFIETVAMTDEEWARLINGG